MINHIRTKTNVTFFLRGAPVTVPSTHLNFAWVLSLLSEDYAGFTDDYILNELWDAVAVPESIATFTEGRVAVNGRDVTFEGKPIHTGLAQRIQAFIASNEPDLARPLCRFLDRVRENPSFRAQRDLFTWLEATGLPIAADGRVIAYKIVKNDYFDIHSGKFDNSVGKIVKVPRYEVDEDPNVTCSFGLHVCSEGYLPHYGDGGSRVIIVAVDPAHWVAVPTDYNNAKARVCEYEVIAEASRETAGAYFQGKGEVFHYPEPEQEDEIRHVSVDESDGDIEVDMGDGDWLRFFPHEVSELLNLTIAQSRAPVLTDAGHITFGDSGIELTPADVRRVAR